MRFAQLTRESDVRFFTGLPGTNIFKILYDHLLPKATLMSYWYGTKFETNARRGVRSRSSLGHILSSHELEISDVSFGKTGPPRKLSYEQEFLLSLMKLRLGSWNIDLAFRFGISKAAVSRIFITWIKLMRKELSVLITRPTKNVVRATLPTVFPKLYPKVRVIIDCTEVFTETPRCLESQALLWSDYKHHCTVKALIN